MSNIKKSEYSIRQKAETIVNAKSTQKLNTLSPDEIQDVVHELEVHQIELEMQNEELLKSQTELYETKKHYFDLYDLAPIGYCTLSEEGLIQESNLAASKLLGMNRVDLIHKPLSHFIPKDHEDTYSLFLKKLVESHKYAECELGLVQKDGALFWAHLSATVEINDNALELRLLFKNISDRKQAAEKEKRADKSVLERKDQNSYRDFLLELSTDFINLPLDEIDLSINKALKKMANFVNTDRAYIFDYDFDAQTTTNTYEWCAPSIIPQIEELHDIPMSFIPGWLEIHAKGEYVLIQDVGALGEGPLRDVLFPQGIKSLVTFPLLEHSKCIGFVGFDAVKVKHTFSPHEISILEIFSKLLSNIAERKDKEEALFLSNQRFEHAELAGNVGSWEYNIDTQDYWGSDQSKIIFGMPGDATSFTAELVESCMTEQKRVHQALVDLIEKDTEYNLEYEINPFDGSDSKIISSIATVEFDDSKKPLKVTGFIQDITEKKHTLMLLEQKKNELETIIKEAPTPMILHEEGGKILMLNQAWIDSSGFSLEDTTTIDDWLEHIYDDIESRFFTKKHIDSLYEITEKVDEGEFTFLNKNRDSVTWQVSSAPLGLIDGKRTIITSAMDITELKRKDQMLIDQSRHAALGEMISMIAHQWRQPLNVISMSANNMLVDIELEDSNDKAVKEHSQKIVQQTQELSKTIDDFRNFFRPDKELSAVKMQTILEETHSIIKDSLKNHSIEFKTVFDTDSEVNAYPRELMQVFVNIITNAKGALEANSVKDACIEVRVYEDKQYVNTEICDNGGGIDPAIINRIFEPYYTTKDDLNGTGLGLYMSKIIVEDHLHGRLEVSNKDAGACFKVRLLKG